MSRDNRTRLGIRFLLSHHYPEHEHRCVSLFGRPVCARCLGLYPALILGLVGLFWLDGRGPAGDMAPRPFEGAFLTLLVAPALVDWVRGRVRPSSGSNAVRLVTGALLGLALARVVHLHAKAPFQQPALDVMLVLALGVAAGEVIARALLEQEPKRNSNYTIGEMDPKGCSDVQVSEGPVARPDERSEHR